jgi:ectoine hydroxylase-related dioxygenase (phytanoyl-CoA dioxygenase family)
VRDELTVSLRRRFDERRRMVLHRADRRAGWYGDDLSGLRSLVRTRDDELVRQLAVLRHREAELDSVLAARSTVPRRTLEQHEVEAFFAEGYLVVDQLSSAEELAVLRTIYDKLFEVRAGRAEGLYSDFAAEEQAEGAVVFPKIHQIYRFAPELVATGFMANARTIAGQLFGGHVEFMGGRGMLKPRFCPGQTPWHQDAAYHRPDCLYRNVNFWLALQDSPVHSGVMHFAPGSHLGSVVHQHRPPDHDRGLELADLSVLSEVEVVACPVPAGGATLHHSYLLHHTPPNETPAPRRALIAIFGLPPTRRSEALRFPWQVSSRPGEPGQ